MESFTDEIIRLDVNMIDPLISLLVAVLLIFIGFVLFWPDRGLLYRWRQARKMTERVLMEDILKHIHNYEMAGHPPTLQSIAGALQIHPNLASDVLKKMEAGNLVRLEGGSPRLTASGRRSALHILRVHRLWERYLADETGFDESEWHRRADRHEHQLSAEDADALSAQLGHPTHDPHGDPIPTAEGELVEGRGVHLTGVDMNVLVRIIHIEDEPETIYAQLVAEGLHPGMFVRIVEKTPQRFRLWANGDEHVLAPIVANNITVLPVPEDQAPLYPFGERLSSLKPGEMGKVLGISPGCRGLERRRLMDLGVLPGTMIKAEYSSSVGDPTAYRIRDALIALREEQANLIRITPIEEDVQ
jgi:DtxR family Mn-dependent transcriptional regulator